MTPPDSLLALAAAALTGVAAALFVHFLKPIWDDLTSRHLAEKIEEMERVYLDPSRIPIYMRLWGIALVALPLVMWLVFGLPLIAVFVAFLLYRMPRGMARMRIRRQRSHLRDQLVSGCTNLANTSRAGLSLPEGFEAVAAESPEPLASELRRVVGEFNRGRPFPEALRESQQRLSLESYTLFTAALLVCMDRGGKITEALDRISQSLQENQRLERKREADTASGRRVVAILAVTPAAFLCILSVLDPDGAMLIFTTLLGQIILSLVAVMDYVSVIWARSILQLDSAAR